MSKCNPKKGLKCLHILCNIKAPYNCLIDGCCKTYRIERALELFDDMGKKDCVLNRVTYNSFIRYYSAVNEIDMAEMMRRMQNMNHGVGYPLQVRILRLYMLCVKLGGCWRPRIS
ncbi:hypothetical protein LWI29_009763 [Acer saccharum]|uniref:Pentatricopeptide repeat-containing protein n=1 Tax=Acer saccharum TaxID=4024 RepID=A0AA39RPH8_ACESA|nr:hypothetical protein LWI29_009763 [Acer saccharum]